MQGQLGLPVAGPDTPTPPCQQQLVEEGRTHSILLELKEPGVVGAWTNYSVSQGWKGDQEAKHSICLCPALCLVLGPGQVSSVDCASTKKGCCEVVIGCGP